MAMAGRERGGGSEDVGGTDEKKWRSNNGGLLRGMKMGGEEGEAAGCRCCGGGTVAMAGREGALKVERGDYANLVGVVRWKRGKKRKWEMKNGARRHARGDSGGARPWAAAAASAQGRQWSASLDRKRRDMDREIEGMREKKGGLEVDLGLFGPFWAANLKKEKERKIKKGKLGGPS